MLSINVLPLATYPETPWDLGFGFSLGVLALIILLTFILSIFVK